MKTLLALLLLVAVLSGCSLGPEDPETLQAEVLASELSALYPGGEAEVTAPRTTHFVENVRYGAEFRLELPLSASGDGTVRERCARVVERLVAAGWNLVDASDPCAPSTFAGCASALVWRELEVYGSDLSVFLCEDGHEGTVPGTVSGERFSLSGKVVEKPALDLYR